MFDHEETFGGKENADIESWRHHSWVEDPELVDLDTRLVESNLGSYRCSLTPKFHLKKKRGELLPMNYYLRYDQQLRWYGGHDFTKTYKATGNTSRYWSEGDGYPFIRGNQASRLHLSESEMWMKAKESLEPGDVQQAAANIVAGWDALTFAAEFTKTVMMFRQLIARWTFYVVTGRWHKLWLEGRYGWRTLVYDMQDINSAIAIAVSEFGRLSRRQARAGGTETWTEVEEYPQTSWSWAFNSTVRIQTTYTASHRGSIIADIKPPDIVFNPIKTTWELVTASFVIDWVLQVGNWLDSLTFLALQERHYASLGVRLEATRQYWLVVNSWHNDSTSSVAGYANAGGIDTSSLTWREPTNVSLRPHTTIDLDGFKVLDLVALFLTKLRR